MPNTLIKESLSDFLSANFGEHNELNLIKQLQSPPYEVLDTDVLATNQGLYQTHFLIYNALYQLRDELLTKQRAVIEINLTRLTITPYCSKSADLVQQDTLPEYYLDWDNFAKSEQEVESMLNDFWHKYLVYTQLEDDCFKLDCQQLGVTESVNKAQLRKQYKKLAASYHPDKGGDANSFKQLQKSYFRLLKRLQLQA